MAWRAGTSTLSVPLLLTDDPVRKCANQMWETVERAGMKSANLMWPGPPITQSGVSPTYFVPWRNRFPLDKKLDQILDWIDINVEQRPQLIVGG